jgi:hypothetical protein
MSARLKFATAFAAACAGCASVVPMQTASVVPFESWRLGGQLGAAAFCSLDDVTRCHDYPDGVPAPELRLDARRGMGNALDLGASLQVQAALLSAERPIQLGLALDARRELGAWPAANGEGAHVVSAGLQVGGAVAGRLTLAPWLQAELAVPVHYGYRTARHEWVIGISGSTRALFPAVGSGRDLPLVHTWRMGASAGVFRRTQNGWALQLGFLTQPSRPSTGALLLQVGWFWDV